MPQTSADEAKELARNSSDCSFLLSHLIRQNKGLTDSESKDILQYILGIKGDRNSPLLKASNTGWYGSENVGANIYNPITGTFDATSNSRSVCFTDSTLAGLRAHRDFFNIKYGLSFDRDWLFEKGANPCLNISESIFKGKFIREGEMYERRVYNFIPSQLHPYINIIHESFDATHEREWRYAGDLKFNIKSLRFIFCPENEFETFSTVQVNGRPCLFDLVWLDRV